jgi:hypothetical protein
MTRALLDRTGLTHCTHTAFWYGISSEFSRVFDAQPPSAFPINRKCVRCLWCQVDLPELRRCSLESLESRAYVFRTDHFGEICRLLQLFRNSSRIPRTSSGTFRYGCSRL